MRVYFPITPKEDKNIRIMKSGAIYGVTPKGPWMRLNHPRNKHDRRAEVANA